MFEDAHIFNVVTLLLRVWSNLGGPQVVKDDFWVCLSVVTRPRAFGGKVLVHADAFGAGPTEERLSQGTDGAVIGLQSGLKPVTPAGTADRPRRAVMGQT